ncbi:hypothetical protein C0995_013988 [Termitomyces sp. Mi166|nr:hypothetical protein C0995_013988 [Termitomyces sp. Mi166\
MYFSAALFASIALVFPTFAISNHLVNVTRSAGITNGEYIVTFKSNNATLSFANENVKVHCYKIIDGCTGKFTDKDIEKLQANPNVEGIYEDIAGNGAVYQTNATWGLARLSSAKKLEYWNIIATNFTFNYLPSAGQGVDIYVIDSGVYVNHTDFGGRARWGKTFGKYPDIDDNGHGTHSAGTTYGVAKHANIIAVKVLDKNLYGWASNMLRGLDYIYESAKASGRPSVVSSSLTWNILLPLDRAVAKLTHDYILVIIIKLHSQIMGQLLIYLLQVKTLLAPGLEMKKQLELNLLSKVKPTIHQMYLHRMGLRLNICTEHFRERQIPEQSLCGDLGMLQIGTKVLDKDNLEVIKADIAELPIIQQHLDYTQELNALLKLVSNKFAASDLFSIELLDEDDKPYHAMHKHSVTALDAIKNASIKLLELHCKEQFVDPYDFECNINPEEQDILAEAVGSP